jgi:predicted dehydrogenase
MKWHLESNALCDRRSRRLSTWDCTRRTRLAQRKFRPARKYLRAAQTFSPSSLRSPCSRRYRRSALIILSYLIPDKPQSVSAKGSDHIEPGLVDVAYLTLHFGNNFIADFHLNWLSPVKVRRNLIGGTRRMLVYGDMELIEKIRIYDRGIQVKSQEEIYKALVDYRMGDVSSPKLDMRQALSFECEHFVDCVRNKKVPRSDGMARLAVVRILEAASISLAK